ncbi:MULTISPECIES: hypothetical protein [Pseudoalteromonas]|uniref:Uncharacterized protein n=1 Tax=Pseudoalteromonas luteoviolacea (strain 2ta16) TaxID=1353533 RepID=V4HDM0_PSEL2|nr:MULTISPECIES: hypothetical protein [Pseudoalteromonas]ESP95556.1 hypothetical protein PL2TA16_02305 [Pseudoalteromonas luteoviolacea 2ta16]MCG7548531.1 hypothetical protein [Pseudoalteromonas sp. Of7M-16]
MKLNLNKKKVKTLSNDNRALPYAQTPNIAGGYRTKTGCNGTTYACHSNGPCHTYFC